MRAGRIHSTAEDVPLCSPARTLDVLNDSGLAVEADVTGVKNTMGAGTGLVHRASDYRNAI